jgi:predicted ester cyclase
MAQNSAKETVLAFIKALNEEAFDTASKYANDDLAFIGVMGSREGAKAYFDDMKRMKIKYTIKQAIGEGDDVCLLYNIVLNGQEILGTGWYQLVNGKISLIRAIFDPRPLLEKAGK